MKIHQLRLCGLTEAFPGPVTVNFEALGPGLIALVGQNGAGKSTLIGSIFAGLFRQLPGQKRSLYDFCTHPKPEIDLAFSVNGQRYRSLLKIDPKSRQMESYLFNGEGEPLTNGKKDVFQDLIRKRIGTVAFFESAIFSNQKRTGNFLGLERSERKELFIRELLGQDYEGLLRRYVRPQLGMKPLVSVQAFDVQSLYREMLDRGLSARSVRYTNAVLRSALKQAVRWKLLLANSAELVDLPRHTRRNVGVLSVEQARTFMAAIVGHPYEALFALAMTTGMRPSEYLALTWADVNLVRGTVSVSQTLEWRKGGWQFADTKRSRSRRVIKLQSWVIALLEKYRQGVDPQAVSGPAQKFVFVAKRGRPIRESKFVRRYFKPLLKKAELPNFRLYDLRHGAATLALAAGVSPKIISEQLGHASVAFTLDVYSHVLPHTQDAAAEKVQALLAGPKTDANPPQTAASLTPVADFPDQ